jgi:predicted acetyltransferase
MSMSRSRSNPVEIRAITDDEVPAFRANLYAVFGGDPEGDPTGDERFRALILPGRAWAAFDRGTVVATAGTFAFHLNVPGGALPIAGLTMVTVRPTHRRRGVLRALIAAHVEDQRRHGEALSGLWASEASIYGRFGYGVATECEEIACLASGIDFGDDTAPDDVELIELEAAEQLLPPVYQQAAATRPGTMSRPPAWWRYRRFADRADLRKGASARHHAIALRGGAVVGYVSYRVRPVWVDAGPNGNTEIEELVGVDGRAERTLWRYVARVDLFPNVTWWNAPTDSIAPWLASDPRRLKRRRSDGMWLRIDDVATTLQARRYLDDGVLRFAVSDPGTPVAGSVAATFELRVEGGAARCARSDAAAEVHLDRASLGAIYLGGVAPSVLARAGRITGGDAALATADRLFRWPVAPWCAEIF